MRQNLCITVGDMLILASQFLKMVSMPTCSLILNFQVGFGGNCGNLHFNLDSYSSNYFIISAVTLLFFWVLYMLIRIVNSPHTMTICHMSIIFYIN